MESVETLHCSTCACPERRYLNSASPGSVTLENLDEQISALLVILARTRTQRNAILPVSRLPTEIFAEVFRYHRDQSTTPWLPVSQVSHSWREMALADPLLWNNINVLRLDGVAERIRRAWGSSFELHLPWTRGVRTMIHGEQLDTLSPLIASVSGHIKCIKLSSSGPRILQIVEAISGSLGDLTHIELTAHGGVRMIDFPDILIDKLDASRMESLQLTTYMLAWDSDLLRCSTRLKRLRLQLQSDSLPPPPMSSVLHTLRSLTQLQELFLSTVLPSWDGVTVASNGPLEPSVHLTQLAVLEIRGKAQNVVFLYRHLRIPPDCLTRFVAPELPSDPSHSQVLLSGTFAHPAARCTVSLWQVGSRPPDLQASSYNREAAKEPHHYVQINKIGSFLPYLQTVSEHYSVVADHLVFCLNEGIDRTCWQALFHCCEGRTLRIQPNPIDNAGHILQSLHKALPDIDYHINTLVVFGLDFALDQFSILETASRLQMYVHRNRLSFVAFRLADCPSLNNEGWTALCNKGFQISEDRNGRDITIIINGDEMEVPRVQST